MLGKTRNVQRESDLVRTINWYCALVAQFDHDPALLSQTQTSPLTARGLVERTEHGRRDPIFYMRQRGGVEPAGWRSATSSTLTLLATLYQPVGWIPRIELLELLLSALAQLFQPVQCAAPEPEHRRAALRVQHADSDESPAARLPTAHHPPPMVTVERLEPIKPDDGLPLESLLAHTADTFAAAVASRLGRGEVLARALYRSWHQSSTQFAAPEPLPAEVCASPALGARLLGLCDFAAPLQLAASAAPPQPGATEKYVLTASGGEEVEMVAMPAPGFDDGAGCWSLCVSSQVGCRMGCAFCETGRMGLLRDLSASEIVSQVAHAARSLRLRVVNVIYMGMGEPLDNVRSVIASIRVLTEPSGLGVALSHVTVSTAGVAPHVPTLLDALPGVRLAFSVHAAEEGLRSRLMPINRTVPLAELAAAMRAYLRATKRRVTIQYVLLANVNDETAHADALAAFLRGVGPLARFHLNLIPYNAQSGRRRFEAPTAEAARAFKGRLQHEHGLFVKIRVEKGGEKMAACGQLGNVALRRNLQRERRRLAAEGAAEGAADGAAGVAAVGVAEEEIGGEAPTGEAAEAEAEAAEQDTAADAAASDAAAHALRATKPLEHRGDRMTSHQSAGAVRLCGREDLSW